MSPVAALRGGRRQPAPDEAGRLALSAAAGHPARLRALRMRGSLRAGRAGRNSSGAAHQVRGRGRVSGRCGSCFSPRVGSPAWSKIA